MYLKLILVRSKRQTSVLNIEYFDSLSVQSPFRLRSMLSEVFVHTNRYKNFMFDISHPQKNTILAARVI